jgi:hypothetical protein
MMFVPTLFYGSVMFNTELPIVAVKWRSPCSVFDRSQVPFADRRPATMTEVSPGFLSPEKFRDNT